ncbi:hypothetical protein DFA_04987 [Cavenderia fasciculata]|uniref:Uncharacterized protein n=1 Tax=Cavenderia fasciculata TaxID=261658 RepID=F4PMR0_CACFS|nr:uncharacterized protein DFA_04987 [Cavenderia fasciculata]EGG22857.1 hypothetical protein DFA_04987 [Cavenderia fasciculata]|eukprot:XP_004360708.1 hypothetical protein DFA_04987 [Cavenderia fasciculata]
MAASKNGLVKVVQCLPSFDFGGFVDSFTEAAKNNQFKVTDYLARECFSKNTNILQGAQDDKKIKLLNALYYVSSDETRFESYWNDFKALTTNSKMVSQLLTLPPFYSTFNRCQISNVIDWTLKNYSRFYDGPERDQYQMQPLQLSNPDNTTDYYLHPFNTYYIISKYKHDPQFNQIINFNDFDINQFYFNNIRFGLIPLH